MGGAPTRDRGRRRRCQQEREKVDKTASWLVSSSFFHHFFRGEVTNAVASFNTITFFSSLMLEKKDGDAAALGGGDKNGGKRGATSWMLLSRFFYQNQGNVPPLFRVFSLSSLFFPLFSISSSTSARGTCSQSRRFPSSPGCWRRQSHRSRTRR